MAGSVSSQPRREAVFRYESLAGQGQLFAAIGKSRSRPIADELNVDENRLKADVSIIALDR
jgi:hypothetical protein